MRRFLHYLLNSQQNTLLAHQRHWLWLSIAIILADQVSKWLANNMLIFGETYSILPLFNFSLAYNHGAAFSFLSDAGGWQRWFFVFLSFTVSIVLLIWILRSSRTEKWQAIALSLVLGGAIGNLIDRIIFGYVIDFIDFFYPSKGDCIILFQLSMFNTCHWPTFNIADSAICIGAILLLANSFLDDRKSAN